MAALQPGEVRAALSAATLDESLRHCRSSVFNHLSFALLISGLAAYGVAKASAVNLAIFGSSLKWLAILAPIAFLFPLTLSAERLSTGAAIRALYAFAAILGISLGTIAWMATGQSLAPAFFAASVMFVAASLWSYSGSTDVDARPFFLLLGTAGMAAAWLVGLLFAATPLQLALSFLLVLMLAALAAAHVARMRASHEAHVGTEHEPKLAVLGALSLYRALINPMPLLRPVTGRQQRITER